MRRSRAPSRVALSPSPAPRVVSDGTDGEKSDGTSSSSSTSQDIKRVNTVALRLGTVNVVRAPLLGCLSVPRGPGLVAGAFKLPGGARRTDQSESLLRRKSLGVRRPVTFMTPSKFRQPGGGSPEPAPAGGDFEIEQGEGEDGDQAEPAAPVDEKPFEPLVLWEAGPGEDDHRISVDPRLCKWLRPHQREGVQFMFECVMGMRDFEGNGCILADDMGLGKTLQSITVLWTLLKQGKEKGAPMVKRAVVVCPTSLVKNWEAEIDKWLKGDCRVIALSETTRDQVVQSITLFLSSLVYRVLIVSYETFRLHSKRFYEKPDSCCDLLICDEAHRLKNSETATNQALAGLKCRRRILLSGTPMQNDLEEFYAMTDFTNPGILGSGSSFRKNFLAPILAGREPSATEKQVERAQKCQNEMSTVVNEFILRRTNNINAKHLPPKLVQVVCCRLTPVQRKIYKHLLSSKEIRHILNGKQTNILSSIGAMQKLCNHPKLLVEGSSAGRGQDSGLAEVASFLPSSNPATALARPGGVGGAASGGLGAGTRRGGGIVQKGVFPEWSGKMETLFRLMREMRRTGDDRIVVVSNYTQSLDLIGAMCRENSWPFVRLDGSTGVSKRQKMVNAFNEPGLHAFAFLLSSKAGGCGLNLIGGNRLVLFDPDWNPAIDKQAAARVWRDGQKKRCFVYRFLTTGTIEEKVFQRQLSKEGLQNIVDDKEEVNSLSSKDLKDLFTLLEGTPSDTHDKLRCKRCRIEEAVQAIKEADALAFQRALPNQLKLCEQLLEELWALPMGDLFHQQWDPETEGIPPETFLSLVHEPMDFGRIAAKLRAVEADGQGAEHGGASPTCSSEGHQPSGEGGAGPGEHFSEGDGREDRSAGNHVGDGLHVVQVSEDARPCHPAGRAQVDAAMAMPYTSVPAFARDMNLVFANIRRVWPMGNPGSDNRLTKAADSLKLTFDTRWRALAPHLHSIQREALEEAREEAKVKGMERAKACEGEGAVPPPRFQEQMGMPKEEDLNSWSHHYSTDTADDAVFRGAMMGTGDSLVSFVFGLEVTWGLMQTQIEAEAEARALEIKAKAEARAARAAAKAEAAAAAAAAAAAEAEAEAETEAVAEGEVAEVTGAGSIVATPQSQSSQSGTSPSREGRQRRRNGRKRKRVASIIDEDEDEDEDEDQGDGEDEDDDDEAQEEDEASSGSEMDFSSQDAGSGDEMAASSSPDAPREADNPRRMKRVKTGSRERVVLPTGSPLAPRESPAGESDRRAQCGRERVKPQEAAAKENCWMHQDGELGTKAGILQQNGDLNSHREEGPEAKRDKTEGVGAGEDREEEEQDVDVEAVSEGGGTQVDDHPEVESSPAGEEGVVRSQSEDEVLETPLSGSDQESALGSMVNAVERSVHGNTAEAGGVRGGNARALGEWLCPKCTFANAASRRKCLMCMEGSRPPGMGRTQPLSPRPLHEGNMESGRHEGPRQRKEKTRRGDESSSKDGTGKESTSSRKMREKKRKREIWIDDDEDYKEC